MVNMVNNAWKTIIAASEALKNIISCMKYYSKLFVGKCIFWETKTRKVFSILSPTTYLLPMQKYILFQSIFSNAATPNI